jgi:mannitol-1-/sugar-/sorbitol-6-phosphatase
MKKVIEGLQAILFDMDGTLVSSIGAVEKVWGQWAQKHGLDVEHVLHTIHGKPARESIKALAPHLELAVEEDWVLQAELAESEGIVALPGAHELLSSLKDFPWAIVTSADRVLALHRLKLAGISLPQIVVTVNDVKKGKPDPEGYLLAATKLQVSPGACLVVEDTVAGLEAGRRAGMKLLGITSSLSAHQLGCENTTADYSRIRFMKTTATLSWEN